MYDVAILCDLRDPGGTPATVAAQIRAAAGLSVVLVPLESRHDRPFHQAITGLLRDGLAELACAGEQIRATVLVVDGSPPPGITFDRRLPVGDDLGLRPARPLPAPRAPAPVEAKRRVLLIGDVTDRLLAVARRLPDTLEPVLLTGAETLPATNLLVEHLPDVTGARWPGFLRARLRHLIELHDAHSVVLDGLPHDGLLAATADHSRVAWWWLRGAMWRRGMGLRWRGRSAAFHGVLEPGEFAAAGDEGWTARERDGVTTLAPITMLDRAELLDRSLARERLGLGDEPAVVLRDVDVPVPGFTPIDPEPRSLRAADLVVSAAGYTAFHETLAAGVPAVFVPSLDVEDDDQLARARFAAAAGVALCAEPSGDLGDVLATAARPDVRAALAARCAELPFGNGAGAAAELIAARLLSPVA
ncbi:glycosyltransferase [Actinoplanes sp. NPDC051633]|uniref:glycosyltransferase n=1 Tax=Actinoplanes sp. NPDC051633 TaxID=3155670 RepID=UPI0034177BDD